MENTRLVRQDNLCSSHYLQHYAVCCRWCVLEHCHWCNLIIIIIPTSRCPSLIGQLSKTDWLLYVLIIGILALGISIPLSLFISEHHNQKGKRIFFKFIEVLTCPISSALLSIILSRCIMEFNVCKMKNRNSNC